MKQVLRPVILYFVLVHTFQARAEKISFNLFYDGLFDNREYKNDMLPQTIYGMRLVPEIAIGGDRHSIVGGVSKIWEFGAKSQPDAGAILYYNFHNENWKTYFGSFPRMRLQRQLPDCMLYDSIALFEPCIQGTAVQYSNGLFQAEAYCNWFSRQTRTQREAFRIVSDGFIGKNGSIFGGGWFVAMTHFAKPEEPGHFIYEQFQINPYIRLDLDYMLSEHASFTTQIGFLGDFQRCRADGHIHTPCGLLANLNGSWKNIGVHSIAYFGERLLPFLHDSESGIKFYRTDPFYNHSFYCKAGMEYTFVSDNNVVLSFCWDLNFTPHAPIHNRQLIKLSYSFHHE